VSRAVARRAPGPVAATVPSTLAASPDAKDAWPYKMADLCRLTKLPRQAIHFYIHEGLVPPGRKIGRNNSRYGPVHLERIRIVRQLQNERFMPLKAIRAAIDGRDEEFTPEQLGLLGEVKRRLASTPAKPRARGRRVDVHALLVRHGLDPRDLADLAGAGIVEVERGPRATLRVAADDAWAFELLGHVRRAGFTHDLGFDARLLRIYERAVSSLVEREWRALSRPLSALPPDTVAAMLEKAMPLVHEFFSRYHAKKMRDSFASTEA
jgi:DNA-binding transcriptional MerR regulator